MRRLSLMLVLVAVLAGCSSGASNVASSKQSTSPTGSSSTSPGAKSPTSTASPKGAATSAKVAPGKATSFCGAFKEIQGVKAADGAAAAGAAYRAAAADMRKFAPAAIKVAATTYADVIDDAGKALASSSMPTRMAGKPADLAKVTAWVTKNCPRK